MFLIISLGMHIYTLIHIDIYRVGHELRTKTFWASIEGNSVKFSSIKKFNRTNKYFLENIKIL